MTVAAKKRVRKRRTASERQLAKIEGEFVRRDRAMSAAAELERAFAEGDNEFPPMVKTLLADFHDPEVDAKMRLKIFETVARFIGIKEQVLAERGLSKKGPKKVVNNNTFTQNNLSMEELEKIPTEVREKLLMNTLESTRTGK